MKAKHDVVYTWSSYRHHAEGKLDISIRDHPSYLALGLIEQERQASYHELFRYQLDPGLIDELREATKQGLIIGSDRFKEIEAILKRKVEPAKRGRPSRAEITKERASSYCLQSVNDSDQLQPQPHLSHLSPLKFTPILSPKSESSGESQGRKCMIARPDAVAFAFSIFPLNI